MRTRREDVRRWYVKEREGTILKVVFNSWSDGYRTVRCPLSSHIVVLCNADRPLEVCSDDVTVSFDVLV